MNRVAIHRPFCIRLAILLLAAALVIPQPVSAASCEGDRDLIARHFVETITRKAGDILKHNPKPLILLKAHILAEVDFDPLARFAIGRFWHRATPAQRADYNALFKETVSHALAQQVLRFRNATLEISKRPVYGTQGVLLRSRLVMPNARVTQLGWRIAFKKDCRPYLVDIMRDNISLITVKRDEFRAVIVRNGISELLTGLRRIAVNQAQEAVGGRAQQSRAILSRLVLEAAARLRQQAQ
jgi:ABC-type transporter MlaC component